MSEVEHLQYVADAIHRRGLADPAIFFLEMYKPLAGCCRELLVMTEPIVMVLLGQTTINQMKDILTSTGRIEELIQLLEVRRSNVGQSATVGARDT